MPVTIYLDYPKKWTPGPLLLEILYPSEIFYSSYQHHTPHHLKWGPNILPEIFDPSTLTTWCAFCFCGRPGYPKVSPIYSLLHTEGDQLYLNISQSNNFLNWQNHSWWLFQGQQSSMIWILAKELVQDCETNTV